MSSGASEHVLFRAEIFKLSSVPPQGVVEKEAKMLSEVKRTNAVLKTLGSQLL